MNKSRLIIASIVFLIILILWPILTYFSLPLGNNFIEQLAFINNSSKNYIIGFLNAFLIAPALIFILYEFYKDLSKDQWSLKAKFLFSLYAVYFIIISISYGSQIILLPNIIEIADQNTILDWYFFNTESKVYLINQTGYLIWSVTTLLIFARFLFKGTLVFFIIKLLTLSSIAQIVATIGLYFGNQKLNTLTFYSGLLLLPAGILIFAYGFKQLKLNK